MANVIQSASRGVNDAQPVMLKARVDKKLSVEQFYGSSVVAMVFNSNTTHE